MKEIIIHTKILGEYKTVCGLQSSVLNPSDIDKLIGQTIEEVEQQTGKKVRRCKKCQKNKPLGFPIL
jgi:hypothetical protein